MQVGGESVHLSRRWCAFFFATKTAVYGNIRSSLYVFEGLVNLRG
jgi:hypothetical protein